MQPRASIKWRTPRFRSGLLNTSCVHVAAGQKEESMSTVGYYTQLDGHKHNQLLKSTHPCHSLEDADGVRKGRFVKSLGFEIKHWQRESSRRGAGTRRGSQIARASAPSGKPRDALQPIINHWRSLRNVLYSTRGVLSLTIMGSSNDLAWGYATPSSKKAGVP